ncbi:MAG: ribulose-phosphate 3-epimerase [Clostridia bacterium]|nr:ribulose-phosphate 3-epimerase [Clostridia bacterium]MDD4386754.1 ribulose-phosphate 3-epimerase [Clostridia bacterium]
MDNFLNGKTISISILNIEDLDSFLISLDEFRKENKFDNISIHFDVMDGDFVPNIGISLDSIKLVKKYNFFVDVHLMCSNPKEYIDKAISLGADNITIHYEIENIYKNLKYLNIVKNDLRIKNKELSIGLSIKPGTDIKKIFNYSCMCDVILLMSVEPGLGGQKYMNKVNKKIEIAIDMKKIVQIDGGINDITIIKPNNLGVSSFVIGSYITKNISDISEKIIKIEDIINDKRGNNGRNI